MSGAMVDAERAAPVIEQALLDVHLGNREDAAAALRIALDRLDIPEPVVLVGHEHPVNVASRELSMRAVNLAFHFAAQAVEQEIQRPSAAVVIENLVWWDTRPDCPGYHPDIAKALLYIELRDPDAFPWRFVRHPEQPHLVRFEDKP